MDSTQAQIAIEMLTKQRNSALNEAVEAQTQASIYAKKIGAIYAMIACSDSESLIQSLQDKDPDFREFLKGNPRPIKATD